MSYNFENNIPIYLQIIENIKKDIINGKYGVSQRLPAVRELSMIYGVNPNTIQKAMYELESAGLIVTDRTNGKYVTDNELLIKNLRDEQIKKLSKTFVENLLGMGVDKAQIIEILEKECGL